MPYELVNSSLMLSLLILTFFVVLFLLWQSSREQTSSEEVEFVCEICPTKTLVIIALNSVDVIGRTNLISDKGCLNY